MNNTVRNTGHSRLSSAYWPVVLILLLCTSPLLAQNTKGDRPASSRENRFKTGPRKEKQRGGTARKIKPKRNAQQGGPEYRPRGKARGGERAGRPIRPVYGDREPSDKQRAWKGDISGRRLRSKNASSARSGQNVHPQPSTTRRRVPDREGRVNVSRGQTVRRQPQPVERRQNVYSNRGVVSRMNARASAGGTTRPGRKTRVTARSASRPYISHRSINVYARFKRPQRRGERAQTTDLAGRRLRKRNYESPRPGLIPTPKPYQHRARARGDRPYSGPLTPVKAQARQSRAWKGDLSGRRIRSRTGRSQGGGAVAVRRPLSATNAMRRGSAYPVRVRRPGIGANGINTRGNIRQRRVYPSDGSSFTGYLKAKRRATGGGSVSARGWNNGGVPIIGRGPRGPNLNSSLRSQRRAPKGGFGDQGAGYSGNLKSRRRAQGGGSVSGRLWNNGGVPLVGRGPRGPNINSIPVLSRRSPGRAMRNQGEEYTGNVRRSSRNAADISVIRRNMQRPQVARRDQGEEYTGGLKARRPARGGGSVSGKLWNNDGTPIAVRRPSGGAMRGGSATGNIRVNNYRSRFRDQGEEFTGYLKARRPAKGGGSVSGNLWNNDETPIAVRRPPPGATAQMSYIGKQRINLYKSRFRDQGEEFTGMIRLSRFRKPYVRNPNAADEALRKARPNSNTDKVDDLQVRVKSFHYVRNPSSASDALKVREPGKAFARVTDYQGNIKMQKYRLFERNRGLHPDAQFVKTNRNNVAEERDALTNLRLWWARLFRKQETQPDHLKEKEKKPRYDKGEEGLWYD